MTPEDEDLIFIALETLDLSELFHEARKVLPEDTVGEFRELAYPLLFNLSSKKIEMLSYRAGVYDFTRLPESEALIGFASAKSILEGTAKDEIKRWFQFWRRTVESQPSDSE